MKTIRTQFAGRKTLFLLAVNWITLIVLSVFFLGEENEQSDKIVGTLIAGSILQLVFLSDQLRKQKERK